MSTAIQCPDHPGLTNDPGHMLNLVDSHCVPYTYVELFLFAVGCLMWVVAYGILIRNALRYKYMEMAALAVCSNFAWEFVWSWCFLTDMGWFLVWTYRAWFFLDIFIVWQLFKWGSKQVHQPGLRAHFKKAAAFAILGFTALYYFYTKGGLDTSIGANSAYMCQLILSSSCLLLILGNPDVAQFSLAVAWLKCIGTGMNTVMLMHHYPGNHFLHTLGILAFLCDSTYIAYFLKLKAETGAGPASAAGTPAKPSQSGFPGSVTRDFHPFRNHRSPSAPGSESVFSRHTRTLPGGAPCPDTPSSPRSQLPWAWRLWSRSHPFPPWKSAMPTSP